MRPPDRAAWYRICALAAATLIALPVLVSCHRNAGGGGDAASAGADTLVGTVRQVGRTPFPRTVIRLVDGEDGDGAAVRVTGPYEDEIRRLVGARVRVAGYPVAGEGPGRDLEVVGYDVVSVDGAAPRVGLLRYGEGSRWYLETTGGLSTPGGEEVDLRGVPEGLRGRLGAKIWVVLGSEGAVQRYGVLRPADGSGG